MMNGDGKMVLPPRRKSNIKLGLLMLKTAEGLGAN